MRAVNLLPPEQRGSARTAAAISAPADRGSAFGAYVVLGFLSLAVAAMAAYVLAGNALEKRRAELEQTKQEIAAVTSEASKLQGYADFKTAAAQRVTTVGDLAKARFDWPKAFGDVSRVLPADVHLRSLTGTISTSSSNNGGNALRGAVQAPAIELSGCTTRQSGVARLMSRLHDVRGVTRVTLASTAAASDETAAAPAEDSDRLCPKGSPPDFQVVAFFERYQVGAGAVVNDPATGTTAAPAATATPAATPAPAAPPASSNTATQGVSSK